ncbi:hypothetical protein EVAR_33912_1 [Eumeta japonica]|uniref:Uncharacterized protein n=1 Tax=Eumeta variegata TaxID=151549 RepID=A0A4C1WIW1_EUMVA|nr:hypothetical protein EVAR_33912_1 [Eumeta japonica]
MRPVKYHTITEYTCKVAVFAVAFSSVLPLLSTQSSSITYLNTSREAGDALMIPLKVRVSMGGDDNLLSAGSPAPMPLDYARKKNVLRTLTVRPFTRRSFITAAVLLELAVMVLQRACISTDCATSRRLGFIDGAYSKLKTVKMTIKSVKWAVKHRANGRYRAVSRAPPVDGAAA